MVEPSARDERCVFSVNSNKCVYACVFCVCVCVCVRLCAVEKQDTLFFSHTLLCDLAVAIERIDQAGVVVAEGQSPNRVCQVELLCLRTFNNGKEIETDRNTERRELSETHKHTHTHTHTHRERERERERERCSLHTHCPHR